MNEYWLEERTFPRAKVALSKAQFDETVAANKIYHALWDIEDAFALVANSFIELERFLLDVGVSYLYEQSHASALETYFDEVRQSTNLKLLSLLTASRVYEEQSCQRASLISDLTQSTMSFAPFFAKAFDSRFTYRVMHALRNHSMHKQLPLGGMFLHESNLAETGRLADGRATRHRTTVEPKILVRDLLESKKVRKPTRAEIQGLGAEHLDLKFFMRGFVAGLAECHEDIRGATEQVADSSLCAIEKAQKTITNETGTEFGVVHVVRQENDCEAESYHLHTALRHKFSETRKKWVGLKWAQNSFVSSEIIKSNDTFPQSDEDVWIVK